MSVANAEPKKELSDAQKARIERNRQKAIHLRQAKLVPHPYAKLNADAAEKTIKVHGTRYIDSGGGFLIEESILKDANNEKDKNNAEKPATTAFYNQAEECITYPIDYKECLECGDKFVDSYLLVNFDYEVCDKCRNPDDKHSLITKTEAKQDYLLKDCDLDKREPPLKYISRKNPHHASWGDMKLYLHLQVEKRALEVWGSEENLRKQFEDRQEKREVTKMKKYNKQLKQLRMDVRSSLYNKTSGGSHTHDFGPETYNEDDDTYTHSCQTCKYTETFEKM